MATEAKKDMSTYNPVEVALESAEEMLELLKAAVARVEVANQEGDPILSAWVPGAKAAIAKAEGVLS